MNPSTGCYLELVKTLQFFFNLRGWQIPAEVYL